MSWLQILFIRIWLKVRRGTEFVLWLCKKVTLTGPGGRIVVNFYTRYDLKTFWEVFLKKEYELSLNTSSVKTIVDLGGNVGYTAAFFYLTYPHAKIRVAEPAPDSFARLSHLANERIHADQVAISNTEGTGSLHIVGNASPSASLFDRKGQTDVVEVKKKSLTRYVEDLDSIDILKIDIEGAEKDVLKDTAVLKARYIIAEIHPDLTGESVEETLSLISQSFECTQISIHESKGRVIVYAIRKDIAPEAYKQQT